MKKNISGIVGSMCVGIYYKYAYTRTNTYHYDRQLGANKYYPNQKITIKI